MSELQKGQAPKEQEEMASSTEHSLAERVRDEGLWKELWYQLRLVWYLLRDPEVPIYLKLLPVVAIIYTLVPTDLVPDLFPFLGQLDDLTALIVGGKVFIEMSPPHVVARYVQAMRSGRWEAADATAAVDEDAALEEAIIIDGEFQHRNGQSQ